MSLKTGAVLVGGTTSSTGGVSTSFYQTGGDNDRELKLVLDDGSDFFTATKVNFKITEAKPQTGQPNGYTQRKTEIMIHRPLLLDNGSMTVNKIWGGMSTDPETLDSERDALRALLVQLWNESFSDEFANNLSLG